MKILITELIWEEGIKALTDLGFTIDYKPLLGPEKEELHAVISEYDGLIVRNETIVDGDLLLEASRLKVIGRLGVGLDNIDLTIAKKQAIKVVAAKHANATSVAEYTMAAMLDASRSISRASLDVNKGNWNRKRFTGSELSGKTLGLFGLGEIAHRVAKRSKAFGMTVIGFDPFITPYDHVLSETGVQLAKSWDEFLKDADFISIHVPLTSSTANVFDESSFHKMRAGSYIINTARGGVINEEALCHAVESGIIAGAYLDVLATEPIHINDPILSVPFIHVTPHIAGLTDESQQRTSLLVAQEIAQVLSGQDSLCEV